MRKRPVSNKDFINNAIGDKAYNETLKEDLHYFMRKISWPIDNLSTIPSMAEGSKLKKPMILPIREYEWNSIERHTKALGVPKSEWIRYAIYKLMYDEQLFCLKNKEK